MSPASERDWDARAHAATLWSGGVLSHRSALAAWGVIEARTVPVHVTIADRRNKRGGTGVVVHRSRRPTPSTTVGGHRVTLLPRSLVDFWSDAHGPDRPASAVPTARRAVIDMVRRRQVAVAVIRTESDAQRTHRCRAQLTMLLDLVEGGCQSELEVWGVLHVIVIAGLPVPVQQRLVALLDGAVFLDVAYESAMVAVELDGAAFHGSRAQREADIRRDAALAALGWVVLRFSWSRLTGDPQGCQKDIAAVVHRRLQPR